MLACRGGILVGTTSSLCFTMWRIVISPIPWNGRVIRRFPSRQTFSGVNPVIRYTDTSLVLGSGMNAPFLTWPPVAANHLLEVRNRASGSLSSTGLSRPNVAVKSSQIVED